MVLGAYIGLATALAVVKTVSDKSKKIKSTKRKPAKIKTKRRKKISII